MKKSLKTVSLLLLLLGPCFLFAQDKPSRETITQKGRFGFGIRGSYNFFPEKNSFRGWGTGGNFKLGVSKKVNTEFFMDFINSDDGRSGYRHDHHVGWSVQISPFGNFGEGTVRPYLLAGQCFDLTQVGIHPTRGWSAYYPAQKTPYVFSAAVQMGLGLSAFIHKNMELTFQAQYMIHLGKDVHIDYSPMAVDGAPVLEIEKETKPDGHIILSMTANYYFLRLWKKRNS